MCRSTDVRHSDFHQGRLPPARAPRFKRVTCMTVPPGDSSTATLFVIDDDPHARKAVAALGGSLGLPCQSFASAEEFLERYTPAMAGCALVDVQLQRMSGLDLQDWLVEQGSLLPVFLISGHADVRMAVRALKHGALTLLEKPYRADELADAIRTGFEVNARARRAVAKLANSHG